MDLNYFFAGHPKAALAFSGGADAAYLLYAGLRAGVDLRPYYVKSAFQPQFELEDALRLCRELGAELKILTLNVLAFPEVVRNGEDRCYCCKTRILSAIAAAAAADGYPEIWDGSNASDDAGDRPGMRALREFGIASPLRLCGLSKPEIRCLSREAGLFTWDKPAYACLATRVKTGETITAERLTAIEESEDFLRGLGFSDFRVRTEKGSALLQFPEEQLPAARAQWDSISAALSPRFASFRLDPKGRKKSL